MYIRVCCFIASVVLWAWPAAAQTYKSDHHPAAAAFAAKNYDQALYAYNQLAFSVYPAVDPAIEMQLGLCYLEKGDFEKASQFFDRAFFSTQQNDIKNTAVLNKCKALLGQNNYPLALSELYSLNFDSLNQAQAASFYLFKAICLYEMEQFEAAEIAFLALINDSSTIQQLFSQPKAFYRPNSTTALIMSAVIPGSGQFYAKEYREGINSVVINGVFVYYWLRILNIYGGIDAFLAVLPWLQRYYVGGFNKASVLAYDKMLANRKAKLAEILAEIDRQTP